MADTFPAIYTFAFNSRMRPANPTLRTRVVLRKSGLQLACDCYVQLAKNFGVLNNVLKLEHSSAILFSLSPSSHQANRENCTRFYGVVS